MFRRFSRRQLLRTASATAAGLCGARAPAGDAVPAEPRLDDLKRAAAYSAEHKGLSMLVMVRGRAVFEDYPGGGAPDRAHELASGTKSFCGVIAAAAQDDGLLRLDEPVSQTIDEWKGDARRQITIRQLLSLVSGIPGGRQGRPPTYAEAIQTEPVAEPGRRFIYGPIPFQIFGEVMRRKLIARKMTALDYLDERIFRPLGVRHGSWRRGADGMPHMPSGAALTARDWARFGQLVCRNGLWDGRRIVSAEALGECFRPTAVNPRYGLTWWLCAPAAGGVLRALREAMEVDVLAAKWLPEDLAMAAGAAGQRLYVSAKADLVIARQAAGILEAVFLGRRSGFSDAKFLSLVFGR